jgi:hypothetical protein
MEATTRTDTDSGRATRASGVGPTADGAFVGGVYAGAFGMLTLLAVLAIAGARESADAVPFVAIPIVLFPASFLLVWRWATSGEGQ